MRYSGCVINKKHLFFTKNTFFSLKSLCDKDIPLYLLALLTNKNKEIMNKTELVDAIASKAGLSKADAKRALDGFIEATGEALKKGDRISLVGFGSFSVNKRPAREGRNPRTGQTIKIAAKKVVRFKAGSDLAKKVN